MKNLILILLFLIPLVSTSQSEIYINGLTTTIYEKVAKVEYPMHSKEAITYTSKKIFRKSDTVVYVNSLEFCKVIYLKDSKEYSIFIDGKIFTFRYYNQMRKYVDLRLRFYFGIL